ncbi:MAG: pyrroloquinoline quinone-dependent dehydrogenase, partial [Acidobacteria bacterium]|nr:pyrroloquinoline quinone-dependent dehydrogenase [Acidobacteriota bacterium]
HQVAAIDPATGKTLWVFTPSPPNPENLGGRSQALSSRGLAYWTDGIRKRLFHNTLDGRLLSIDAKTGRADSSFGRNETVNLKERLVE